MRSVRIKRRQVLVLVLLVIFVLVTSESVLADGFFTLASDVLETIHSYYFKSEVSDPSLIQAAIRGMFSAVSDACNQSITSTELAEFMRPSPATISGALSRARQFLLANCQERSINDNALLYGAIKGMVKALNDPLSEFMDPGDVSALESGAEDHAGIGVEIGIYDGQLTVYATIAGTPAEAAGIQAGDKILKIDGESTEGITLSEAAIKIRGEIGTTMILTVHHKDGTQEDIPVVRDKITVVALTSKLVDDNRIGYIHLSRFDSNATLELDKALAGFDFNKLAGIILDMRNNPGGLLSAAISVSSRFVDKGVIVSTKSRISGEQNYYSSGNKIPNLPLAVLVNSGTSSAAEITAGAIRDHKRGILIGEPTAGASTIQQRFNYSDGSALKLTIGEWFTPNGHSIDNVGLNPSIVIKRGWASNNDPYLAAAITWIHSPSRNFPPTPFFTLSSNRVLIAKATKCDASGSYDPDGTIVKYEWDFGDGTPGNGKVAAHAFSTPGTYTVKLTVTDNDGVTASIEKEVKVFQYGGEGGPA